MIRMAKVTKRDNFVAIADVLDGLGKTDLVEFVEHEIELLDKRKSGARKPTKAQVENEAVKAEILDALDADAGLTATEVAKGFDPEISVQKASQLLRQLVAAGLVVRIEGKGKTKTQFYAAG